MIGLRRPCEYTGDMNRSLKLSDSVYRKLKRSAAQRGLTVEAWLELMSDAAVRPVARERDRRRGRTIERLLEKCQDGSETDTERAALDRLIDEEYRVAIERADQQIATKRNGRDETATKLLSSTKTSGRAPRSSAK